MKTTRFLALVALCASMTFVACQKDDLAKPNSDFVVKTRAASFSYSPANPCPGDEVTVTFTNQSADCGNVQIQQLIDGEYEQVVQEDGNSASYTFVAEEGDNDFRAQWFRTGNPATCPGSNSGWIESTLIVEPCCADVFTAELTCSSEDCSNTLVVTFSNEDYSGPIVIQGGLTSGTTICDLETVQSGLELNPDHNSAGGPSNVTRWEGDVIACETYTITINFSGGDGVGHWSAKAGELVLGESDEQECP